MEDIAFEIPHDNGADNTIKQNHYFKKQAKVAVSNSATPTHTH